ncbi:Cl-channel protein [Lyophyllum atratum]|nr:Cl-channel protein [Lyophyllum atratum]
MPSERSMPRNEQAHIEEELYELTEDGRLPSSADTKLPRKYEDGSSIDWLHEEAVERERTHALRAQAGARGLLFPLIESARLWFVVIMVGLGIGITGAWLDVLVKWLGDLREGHCSYGFFYNQVACCSGLDPGEKCREWITWSEFLHVRSIFLQSLLQSFIYVVLAIAFAGSAALLVESYAPYAFHTGIPEIKAILGGYVFDSFLSPWTLIIKAVGLALAVASGLSLGKEGPLVHVACCMAFGLSRLFKQFRHNEAQKRKLLAAAAAAGVSVAFGSPLGGVLFGLEELDTFADETDVMWRAFVASAIAAVSLQWVNPFGTAKLVLFQVNNTVDVWRAFELIPWLGLGILGGVLGSLLIKLNVEIALVPASELVANLFQECDTSRPDYHGLCNPTAMWENIFLLILTAIIKIGLTAWTFDTSWYLLPTIAIGACLGRAVGLLTQGLYRAYPTAWIFLSCPPDPSERCISPGFYAVLGASAMLGGVTRMTISLVVIVFELTGALSHVLPIMICVMTSKWVGDAMGKDGIYSVWIAMRNYPWLPPVDYHDKGETGADIMKPLERLVVIDDEQLSTRDLENLLEKYTYDGFPVVRQRQLIGFATRDRVKEALEMLAPEDVSDVRKKCSFSIRDSLLPEASRINLSVCLEEAVLQLRKEVPQELVVNMFQKLNLRRVLFTHTGELMGMTTKADVVLLLTRHFPHTAALSQRPPDPSWQTTS